MTRDRQLYDFITGYTALHGIAPTLKEMAKGLDIKVSQAWYTRQRLVKRGLARVTPYKSRGTIILTAAERDDLKKLARPPVLFIKPVEGDGKRVFSLMRLEELYLEGDGGCSLGLIEMPPAWIRRLQIAGKLEVRVDTSEYVPGSD